MALEGRPADPLLVNHVTNEMRSVFYIFMFFNGFDENVRGFKFRDKENGYSLAPIRPFGGVARRILKTTVLRTYRVFPRNPWSETGEITGDARMLVALVNSGYCRVSCGTFCTFVGIHPLLWLTS